MDKRQKAGEKLERELRDIRKIHENENILIKGELIELKQKYAKLSKEHNRRSVQSNEQIQNQLMEKEKKYSITNL